MGVNRRLILAVAVSVLLHGVLAWWLDSPSEPTPSPVRLEVVLTPVPAAPDASARVPEPADEPPDLDPPLPATKEAPVARTDPDRQPAGSPPGLPRAPTRLNLQRPSGWDDLVAGAMVPPGSGNPPRLAFNPALEAALGAYAAARERRALLADRGAAVYGVADESFSREGAWGTQAKRDGRCVTLVDDPVEGGTRWWAGRCTETRRNPFSLEPLEYDGLGRVVAD